MRTIAKVDHILTSFIGYMATAAFVGVATCVCLGIMARWLNISVMWTEEVSRYFLIWFVYTAALTGHQYIEDTCVDFFFQKFSPTTQKILRNIYRIIMIIFLLLVMRYGIDYAILGLKKQMVTVPLSIFWVRLAIPFGCAFMSFKWLLLIILSYGPDAPYETTASISMTER